MQFNIPTLLTLFRVVLIPFFVLAFYLPVVWAPFACALLFLIAAVTDDMIDTIAIACTPAAFGERLTTVPDVFDHLDLIAPPWGLTDEQTMAVNRAIIDGLRGRPAAG